MAEIRHLESSEIAIP